MLQIGASCLFNNGAHIGAPLQWVEKGEECNIEDIRKDIADRDYRDMHRETAPLRQAEDAVLLDTSDMDIEGVVSAMKKIIGEKIPL